MSIDFARPFHAFIPWAVLLSLTGCDSATQPTPHKSGPVWFADSTGDSGIDFVHDPGPESYFMPLSMGSGAAVIDFDQDGDLDVYLIQGAGPESKSTNRLFRQDEPGRFSDVTERSGLGVAGFGTGIAVGDVNNDDYPDVFLAEYGRIRLFLNQTDGTFQDISDAAGLSSLEWGTSAAFLDFDRDGWLDLFVVNYVQLDTEQLCYTASGQRDFCSPESFPSAVDRVYRNVTAENDGTVKFEDVTTAAGISVAGPGLGVICADFDGDDWLDVFVANDRQANRLWINQHNGTFEDQAISRGVAVNGLGKAEADMGVAIGDVNGDGLFDLFVTHFGDETHTLWQQGPRGLFQDRTAAAGLTGFRSTGFGAALADFDLDGHVDLAFVNGQVAVGPSNNLAELGPFWSRFAQENSLLRNDGSGKFEDIADANPAFCGKANVGRGLCCADLDGDGAMDLLVSSTAGRAKLLRNVVEDRGNWLMVRAIDPRWKRNAIGARITVSAGDRTWISWINPGSSYQCSGDPRAHFGLGDHSKVDRVDIRWPDGMHEAFPAVEANQVLVLKRGEGTSHE